jgi:hypothetical protein
MSDEALHEKLQFATGGSQQKISNHAVIHGSHQRSPTVSILEAASMFDKAPSPRRRATFPHEYHIVSNTISQEHIIQYRTNSITSKGP